MIYTRYLGSPLAVEEQSQLKTIDDALLWYDLKNLLGEAPQSEPPVLHIDMDYTVRPFADVEKEYLDIFHRLYRDYRKGDKQ